MHEVCDDACPPRLMAGTEACAVVSVKVLVKQDVVAPARVGLERLGAAVHGTPPRGIAQEHAHEPPADFHGDLPEIHHLARAGRALDAEARH